jgi:hypothetical protein
MAAEKGRIERNGSTGNGQADMFCRTVFAAIAAMLALRLCQLLKRWVEG